jgi:hypothetical protein
MNRFFRILFMIFLFLSAGVFQIGRAEAKMVSVGLSIEKASIKVSSSYFCSVGKNDLCSG